MKKYWKWFVAALVAALAVGFLTGCTSNPNRINIQKQGQQLTNDAFRQQQSAEPYPASALTDSTERANLIRHLLRFNDPNKIGYIYVMNFGKIVGYYVIKGKPSSNQSQLTTSTLEYGCGNNESGTCYTVPAPGDDGSYGANEDGIFFFTSDGVMVVTNLDYLYADQPLQLDVPLLGGQADAKESTADLQKALQAECASVGKAAGVSSTAGQACSEEEIKLLSPKK